ncbi:hypothetical protein LG296_07115 [Ureibacillus chungkukjangi]|uniref:hypothetical protein n=1 Tax=Ureibacillus chungkukjangi TaxID=1202712 RepID=UPI00384B86CD
MAKEKILNLITLCFVICSLLWGCSNNITDLEEIKGSGLTYSEFFKELDKLDERENVTYYKPVPISEMDSINTFKNVEIISTENLPFEVDEEMAYLVTSEDSNGNDINQIQFSYLNKSEYESVEEFFIISITEARENPIENNRIFDEVDLVGNELRKDLLTEDIPIYQQIITTDSAMLYRYYNYDKNKNSIDTVGTAANEFYTYYNGYVYHIGYLIDKDRNTKEMQEHMLRITRDLILGNS